MNAQLSADSLPQKREHNFGVDLLRCVGMLMIVTLHILNRGGGADGFAGGMDIAVKTFRFFAAPAAVPPPARPRTARPSRAAHSP